MKIGLHQILNHKDLIKAMIRGHLEGIKEADNVIMGAKMAHNLKLPQSAAQNLPIKHLDNLFDRHVGVSGLVNALPYRSVGS